MLQGKRGLSGRDEVMCEWQMYRRIGWSRAVTSAGRALTYWLTCYRTYNQTIKMRLLGSEVKVTLSAGCWDASWKLLSLLWAGSQWGLVAYLHLNKLSFNHNKPADKTATQRCLKYICHTPTCVFSVVVWTLCFHLEIKQVFIGNNQGCC